ncbi:MAG: hypothetical protein U1F06_00730 [Steroidobacteraceae bacterium]
MNSIAVGQQPRARSDRALERRIEAWIRWNAMAMVVQANRKSTEYGGHISSYASSATMYEVGFNHFWRAASSSTRATWSSSRGTRRRHLRARRYLEDG